MESERKQSNAYQLLQERIVLGVPGEVTIQFDKYLSGAYYVVGAVPGSSDSPVNKTDKNNIGHTP